MKLLLPISDVFLIYCLQRFQKCEYAKTKLFKTEGRGWGLLANENVKVIAYKVIMIRYKSETDISLLGFSVILLFTWSD